MTSNTIAVLVGTVLTLNLAGLAAFFVRRGLWSRGLMVALVFVPIAAVAGGSLGPVLDGIRQSQSPGFAVALSATLVLLPLISVSIAAPIFQRLIREIEDVLIIALDTDEWSDDWKVATAAEGFEQLIADSSEIQREWLRQKQRGTSFLPLIAAVVFGEDRKQVAEYLQRHRRARYDLLQIARTVEKQAFRPSYEPDDEVP